MLLCQGGLDIFYVDESHDRNHYVVTSVRIPFLRNVEGNWQIVWPDFLAGAKAWRRAIRDELEIPTSKELHGVKFASARGRYIKGKHSLNRRQAARAYETVLRAASFMPPRSVMSAVASRGTVLYGHDRLEKAAYALFQRMRSMCASNRTNGIVFFDEGHGEYRRLYRKAQVFLLTGSARGGWEGGQQSKNMPLDMFTKDANEKRSKHCYFTQIADLVAYAAFLKIKGENHALTQWQQDMDLGRLYDHLPRDRVNTMASHWAPRDGIARLR
jgi:hypothetical protein